MTHLRLTGLFMLLAASAAAAAVPVAGRFAGHTSQHGQVYRIHFSVSGDQIRSVKFVWHARCASGAAFDDATAQGKTRIVLRNGAWSSSGAYVHKIAHTNGLVGHFKVVVFRGHFTDSRHSRGVFRLVVKIFDGRRQIDTCHTGTVDWSATKTA